LGPNSSVPVNQWSHLTSVWKSGQIEKLYIDGVEVANDSNPATGSLNIQEWVVGQDRAIAGRFFDGTIQNLKIWTRALSASEVSAQFSAGLLPTQLLFRHSGKCIDNKGATAQGAEYHQWTCGADPNRNFTIAPLGGGYFSIKSEMSNRCLDVAGGSTADGGKLHQWTCDASNVNQSWKFDAIDSTWFQVKSRHSGKCVDVETSSTVNGARIFQKNCDTTKQSQHLRME